MDGGIILGLVAAWLILQLFDSDSVEREIEEASARERDAKLAASIANEELRSGKEISDITIRRYGDGEDGHVEIQKRYRR